MRNRFRQEKTGGETLRSLAAPLLLFAVVIGCVGVGIHSADEAAVSEQKSSLEKAIHRDMVTCYALEGRYPESLSYMQEHYGLTYDEDRYIVHYEVAGTNLMPDVTIFEKN